MKLSVLVPAYNEEGSIGDTVRGIHKELKDENIPFELLVINDHSSDSTEEKLIELSNEFEEVVYMNNKFQGGFGRAVRFGLEHYSGDCVAIMMADLSDSPEDLVKFYKILLHGNYDAVFGSRFQRESKVVDYPKFKLFLNRIFNLAVKIIFKFSYNDCTNAFKIYRRETIDGIRPILAPHFNITLEIPLKVIVRGYHYEVISNSWVNRQSGESKLKIKEMGSRYFFILLYCFIEKYLSHGDFTKAAKLQEKITKTGR